MRRYTTPTQDILVRGVDMTNCDVYITYKQGQNRLELMADPDVEEEGTYLHIPLSQLQTAQFKAGVVNVQVNWINPEGVRDASEITDISIEPNLLEREVTYGE